MKKVLSKAIALIVLLSILTPLAENPAEASNSRTLYTYHTYATLVTDMENLNSTYPNLVELFTAQDKWGLNDTAEGYKIWIMRITNESNGFNKPEVLFVGGHHGDETVGVEIGYYYAEFLVENYDTDPYIKFLLDNREIYIVPVVNPYGWVHGIRYDENGEDLNRDYPFDEGNDDIDGPLTGIGSRALHELMKEHLFITVVSWHGGIEMIAYAWGAYCYDTPTDESPDDIAYHNQAELMSEYAGPYSGYYQFGRCNQILYPVHGGFEDYAYAASWDVNANSSWPTEGCRALTYCVEVSSDKDPPESTLGGSADIYTPGGAEDGYIPKNIRIALVLTDIAEPYINITNRESIPSLVAVGQNVTFKWEVKGALSVAETDIQFGTDSNPQTNFTYNTTDLSGGTAWDGVEYTEVVTMPSTPGDYYFVIRARVDQDTLNQDEPTPDVVPQSLFVNMRTNDSWSITNNNNTLQGHLDWYSEVIHIKVGAPLIEHEPLKDTEDTSNPYRVNASITDDDLNESALFVYYNINNQTEFTQLALQGYRGYYYADIPAQDNYTTVYYYIEAGDLSGNVITHPILAEPEDKETLHHFYVGPDNVPPEIIHNPIENSPQSDHYKVTAIITDNIALNISSLSVYYSTDGTEFVQLGMTGTGNADEYSADIPGQSAGTTVYYYIEAKDMASPPNVGRAPSTGAYSFNVVPDILVVDDDDGANNGGSDTDIEDYMTQALSSAGYDYDVYTVNSGDNGPNLSTMQAYGIVIWLTGEDYSGNVLTSIDENNLGDYLDGGGRLWLVSQDFIYTNGIDSFASNYLHVGTAVNDEGTPNPLDGVEGDVITDGMSFPTSMPSGFDDWGDVIEPDSYAVPIFWQDSAHTQHNAIRYGNASTDFRTVFFGFEFAVVSNADDREELADKVVAWLTNATSNRGTLRGNVTDTFDNPIEGALVSVLGTGKEALSQENGSYEIVNLIAGNYTVNVEAFGYYNVLKNVTITPANISYLNFELLEKAKGNVSGFVKDINGTAIAGANISITNTTFYNLTDDNGSYFISDVPIGNYTLRASASGYMAQEKGVQILENTTVSVNFTLELKEPANWTFMVYCDADNNLHNAGLDDLNEMESAGSTDAVNIIVLLDLSNYGDTKLYYVEQDENGYDNVIVSTELDDENFVIPSSGEVNMADPQTLKNFGEWVIENYPAEHYLLSIWDHGSGIFARGERNPTKGVCWDDTDGGGDYIDLAELRDSLSHLKNIAGKMLDIVGFDVCVLGQIETHYQMIPYVNYGIASQDNEPFDGWDYEAVLLDLVSNSSMSPEQLAIKIVDYYVSSYSGGSQGTSSVTQAAVNLTKLYSDFVPVLNNFADELYYNMYSYQTEIQNARNNAEYYNYPNPDLYHFAQLIESENSLPTSLRSSAQALMDAYPETVIAEGHTGSSHANAHGLSIYFPTTGYNTDYDTKIEFSDERWDEFIHMYQNPEEVAPSIVHVPLSDTEDTQNPYNATAIITSNIGLYSTYLYYNTNGSANYTQVEMLNGSAENEYYALIPTQPANTTLFYYIEATDVNNHTKTHPAYADPNDNTTVHSFFVGPDTILPVITHTPQTNTTSTSGYNITAIITDNIALNESSIFIFYSTARDFVPIQMNSTGNENEYYGIIPGQEPGTLISYYIVASDNATQPNTARHPESGYHQFLILEISMIFFDDFEGVISWSYDGLWHLTENRSHSSSHSFWYANESTGNYDTGTANSGSLTSPEISLIGVESAYLSFWYWYETEGNIIYDQRWVQISVNGSGFFDLEQLSGDEMNTWLYKVINLTPYIDNIIQIRFYFDTVDEILNAYEGWYIDDVGINGSISIAPPQNLTIYADGNDLVLTWDAVPSAHHYNIYMSYSYEFNFSSPFATTNLTYWVHENALSDYSDYIYIVRSATAQNHTESNTNKVGKCLNNLSIGWNFISIPTVLENTTIESVLLPINGSYDVVWYYDAFDSSDHWKKYSPQGMPWTNDLTEINESMGFWIKMIAQAALFCIGKFGSRDLQLKQGWNMVGYPSIIPRDSEDVFSTIITNLNRVWAYFANDSFDPWKVYKPEGMLWSNDLSHVLPKFGYWVLMDSDDAWEIES